jgi:calcium-dependent protein kinase
MGCFPNRTNIQSTLSPFKKNETILSKKLSSKEERLSNILVIKIENSKLASSSDNIKIKNLITKVDSQVEDNYKILNKLGKGSFGSVFKVLHINSGLLRAMKIIKKENLIYQDDDKKFLNEVKILMACEHPNIIKIFEYYNDEHNFYLITEYISGGELYETIVSWKTFDEEKACYIMSQILEAINYLHSIKIIHRDIKPENILVENKVKNNDNEMVNIKLIDFGASNYYEESKKLTLKVGSPYYIAPEVIKKYYDQKCDLWSCGVMMYILLVGYPPFTGNSQKELLTNIVRGIYSLEGPEWLKVSTEAKDLISKLLELDTKVRYNAEETLGHPWMIKFSKGSSDKVSKTYFATIITNISNFNAKEKLQQATLAYIVHFLYNSIEIDDLKKVFKMIDKNGDGRLTYDELKNGFEQTIGSYLTDLELNKIIQDVDGDNDGFISYEEFLRVAINQKQLLDEKSLKIAFERFDVNKDGKLSKEEIKEVLGTSDNRYINILLDQVDQNNDGYISFQEFTGLMNGVVHNAINVNTLNLK